MTETLSRTQNFVHSWQQCRCTQGCEKIRKIKLFLSQLTPTWRSAELGHFQYSSFWQRKCHQKKVKISSHANFHMNNFHAYFVGSGNGRGLFNVFQVEQNVQPRFVQMEDSK